MISLVSVTMADCLITIPASLFVNTQQYYQVIEAVLSTSSRQ